MMEYVLSRGDEGNLEEIIEAFSHELDEDRYYYETRMHQQAALKAITLVLGENGSEEGTCLLLSGRIHPGVKIRAGAAHLLGKLGEKRAAVPYCSLLEKSHETESNALSLFDLSTDEEDGEAPRSTQRYLGSRTAHRFRGR